MALIDGLILYIYINFINKAHATSAVGLPFIQVGALLGIAVQILAVTYIGRMVKKMQQVQGQIMTMGEFRRRACF